MKIKDKNFLIHFSKQHTQHNAIFIQDEYNLQVKKLKEVLFPKIQRIYLNHYTLSLLQTSLKHKLL